MITELKGVWLVSHEEGVILGKVSGITVDPDNKTIMALAFKPMKGGKDGYVLTEKVERVGRDIILVTSESDARFEGDLPGRDLKDLQGSWVTTLDGNHLGVLVDLDFGSDWKISELEVGEGRRVEVVASEVKLGDEILIPAEYLDRVKEIPKEKYGAMGRLIGRDRIDDVRKAFKRMIDRKS